MTHRKCEHNRMTEVLPYLWIGGTKKHTEMTRNPDQYSWCTKHVRVVETAQTSDGYWRWFVCPNYGTPSVAIDYWLREVRSHKRDSADEATTVVTDLGGHGRSGLYCAIIMAAVLNISGKEAIARLRQLHCEQAVETPAQEAYVIRIANELKDWKG